MTRRLGAVFCAPVVVAGDAAAAAVSMKLFEQRLAVARQAPDLLVAAVAERLAQRRSCLTSPNGR